MPRQPSSSGSPPSGEERGIAVRVRLRGGHAYEVVLPAGSQLLHELLEQPLAALPVERARRLFELPLDGGRSAVTFRAEEIAAVETTPPYRTPAIAERIDQRSVADLAGPNVLFSVVSSITDERAFAGARKRAERHLAAFEERLDERRQKLRRICDRMETTTFVVSAFNAGFVPLLRNWAASCDRHGVDARRCAVLFPTDDEADAAARELGFVTCFDPASYGEQPRGAVRVYGDRGFASCIFLKLAMAQDMLQLGYDFLLQDMDLIWFADPLPDLTSRAMADRLDFQFMRDMNRLFQPLYYNSGFIFVRNNPLSRHVWQMVLSAYPAVVFHRSDQVVVNQVISCFKERGLRTARLPERYVDGQILAQVDVGVRALPPDSLVAHVNWTSNLGHKIERLKKLDLWYLD